MWATTMQAQETRATAIKALGSLAQACLVVMLLAADSPAQAAQTWPASQLQAPHVLLGRHSS